MEKLSHNRTRSPSLEEVVNRAARCLARAGLHYGHGTAHPRDDAAAIAWHVLGLAVPAPPSAWRRRVSARDRAHIDALVERRIRERIPVVYLTNTAWFAGLPLHVDERVLIPRSPIAEPISRRFAPWIDPRRVRRVLDLGTGSGCIAIACARAFPRARIVGSDIAGAALDVARINVRRHRLGRRVRLVTSDHFARLGRERFDIIVSNPPYVGAKEYDGLPLEYWHEPRDALEAGRDGLDSVRVLLAEAPRHLRPGGLLVVEVGNTEALVRRRWPRLPFTWLEFEHGGGGVFLLTAEQLAARAG
jgi:ribosomal protein L3 glutamine methyltransferase